MKTFSSLFALLLFVACASVTVTSDYDRNADFAKYKTYGFSEETMKMPLNQLNRDRILAAVETELAAKGFTKSDQPDVVVDLLVKAETRTEATATNMGGYYGRYGWAGGMGTTTINYNEYTDGTLFITFIDNAQQKIFWQGRGVKTIDENASAEKREQNINYVVKSIMAKYPPQIKK
jgi:hypothetical protein